MDEVRELIKRRVAELELTLSALSQSVGRNHAYMQQFIERGVPKRLPEDVRAAVASRLGVSEDALGKPGSNLERQHRYNCNIAPYGTSLVGLKDALVEMRARWKTIKSR